MALSEITHQMMAVSRFGCDIIRLTKGKKGHEEPYGPIQVRFCDGAVLPMQDVERAQQIVEHVSNRIESITLPLRTEYRSRMVDLLETDMGTKEADTLHDLAGWVDAMEIESVMLHPQAEGCVIGLNGYWCCHVPENRDRSATEIARSLKEALSSIRNERYTQLRGQILEAINEPR